LPTSMQVSPLIDYYHCRRYHAKKINWVAKLVAAAVWVGYDILVTMEQEVSNLWRIHN
jgi:hypothetical protein